MLFYNIREIFFWNLIEKTNNLILLWILFSLDSIIKTIKYMLMDNPNKVARKNILEENGSKNV